MKSAVVIPLRYSRAPRSSLPSQRIARLMLCFREETLIVLHGFIKKTQKTPADEFTLAKRRMNEMKK
jgi:phage-related protein